MIAVFDDADNVVTGALGAVNALIEGDWGDTGGLEMRVSVHAGSASERDGDFFGSPVNKVARINGIGNTGQVLVSDVARQLMNQPAGVDLGMRRDPGAIDPSTTCLGQAQRHGRFRGSRQDEDRVPRVRRVVRFCHEARCRTDRDRSVGASRPTGKDDDVVPD
jgi:hypothetical protein